MRLSATCVAALAATTLPALAAELRLSGPYTHDNLAIYLVHGQDRFQKHYLTLAEALQQRKVFVYETSNVNQLLVENVSGEDVYIQSGDIVKGGKQDRVLKDDIIVPSFSGKVPISAFCVEHGRWTRRGNEQAGVFSSSANAVASPEVKRAIKAKADQSQVWAEVAKEQDRLSTNTGVSVNSPMSASSYQLSMETPKLKQTVEAFKKNLANLADTHPDALGYVLAVNGKVTGSDVYATHELFRKLWPKLLESAAVEAIGAKISGVAINPPAMSDVRVRAAASGYGARVTDEKQLNGRTNSVQAELPEGLVFETKDAAAPAGPVHRSYVTK